MADLQPTIINGHSVGHSNVRISLGSYPFEAECKEIKWNETMSVQSYGAAHPVPVDPDLGTYATTASMTITKQSWDLLLSLLPEGYTTVKFPAVSISYLSYVTGGRQSNVLWRECRIVGVDSGSSSGGGVAEVALTWWVKQIFVNGKSLAPTRISNLLVSPPGF